MAAGDEQREPAARAEIDPVTITRTYFDLVVERDRSDDVDYVAQRLYRKLSAVREPKPGDRILDVGSSTGVTTAALQKLGFEAVGIDVVPEFVEVARRSYPELEFEVARAEELPFEDASFDFLNLTSLLEHVDDWRKTLRESARVLKPGGVLYLATSNRLWPAQNEIRGFPGFGYLPSGVQRRIYRWAMRRRPELVAHTHLPAYHWLTYWQIAAELKRNGLEPRSWMLLMGRDDVPESFRKYMWLLRLAQRSPLPLFALSPGANLILARKTS